MCFETGWAALLSADLWSKWAGIATALIAFIALRIARKQLKTAREESKRALAHSAYNDYLTLCFENTKFSYGNEKGECQSEYKWFVSKMLFAFEQIIEVYPDDIEWKTAIKNQLKMHSPHLTNSNSVSRKDWSNELTKIIQEVIESDSSEGPKTDS
ncbi:hypothetical protein CWB73_11125 [Pseudoalteromonas phenolica]|uniref:DUF4760 domain-containing protein n=1 Tax=Pseudoalteromonas phenolica TaxID=161398 RepID=A0A5S3YV55_9GAMM|nr:hypothetical protein [Pseudoalteromonas phenolica]TMP80576.1 hypothetical protein CWB73_11125 [Pseudoalteromonas phenolica]